MEIAKTLTLTYTGIAFRQNTAAPELFAFVAAADDLKKICGVARKSEHMLTNYQRALDEDRVNREVAPFFRIPQNSTPTAVVLSLHSTPVAEVRFEDIAEESNSGINLKKLTVTCADLDALNDEEVISAALTLLAERLESEEVPSTGNNGAGSEGQETSGDSDESEESAAEDEEDEESRDEDDEDDEDVDSAWILGQRSGLKVGHWFMEDFPIRL